MADTSLGPLLALVALAFVLVTGANDGATIVAINLVNPAVRPLPAIVVLTLMVAAAPLVLGTAVAETFSSGLVDFAATDALATFGLAVLAALAIVWLLSRAGWPTSLTLALIGALVGSGVGRGLQVAWPIVGTVLLVAALCLVVSVVAGMLALRLLSLSPRRGRAARQLQALGSVSFALQSLAYAANDAQKMVAVMGIALGLSQRGQSLAQPLALVVVGLFFALGTLIGVERLGPSLGRRVVPVQARHVVAAQFGSAATVLGSSFAGVPVSMTQAAAASLVGAAMSERVGRVRWQHAARIAAAWLITLPAAALAGMLLAIFAGGPA